MTQQQFSHIYNARIKANEQFKKDFAKAQNYSDLLQVYASYCGNLEALIDTYEVSQLEKRYKHE